MSAAHSSSETLAQSLVMQIKQLREERGHLSLDDVTMAVQNVLKDVQKDLAISDTMHRELEEITNHIHNVRQDMALGIPAAMSKEKLSSASSELGQVLEVTEEAANIIMDASDEIQSAVSGSGVDPYVENKVMTAVTRIYEACNFQDLAGQRVSKVIRFLGEIEDRLARLVALIGGKSDAMEGAKPVDSNKSLMNGPQDRGSAPSQADIDALFNDL